MANMIGDGPDQVPTNASLGGMAWQDPDSFRAVGLQVQTKAGTVVAADIPVGHAAVIQDTVGGTTKLYANIGGALMSVALA